MANMSHELRQPLHIIIGFTEALKEEAADLGAAAIEPDLNKILAAAKHLLDLINDILDLAKISAGKMELAVAPFPLAEAGGRGDDPGRPAGREERQHVRGGRPAPTWAPMTADERRVRQILHQPAEQRVQVHPRRAGDAAGAAGERSTAASGCGSPWPTPARG